MTRWFTHAAVIAAWLGLGTMVLAQPGNPTPFGAARNLQPLQYMPEPQPNLAPGPLNPLMAPAGPPPTLNLPADHTNAFPLDGFAPESKPYGSVGGMSLQRQGLTRTPIVFADDQNGRIDTGGIPIGRLTTLLPLDRMNPNQNGGTRATVGFLLGNQAFELTGFYLPAQSVGASITDQGRLLVPFALSGAFPIGFEGNNGIWSQADRVETRFTSALGNGEANYRLWNSGMHNVELIVGLRYTYSQERVDIYTDDEFFVRDIFDRPDPLRQATYSVSSRNNYLGAQFGGEFSTPIPVDSLSWIWLTAMGKTSLGVNWVERSWRLNRGDGRTPFDIHQNTIIMGSVSDVSAMLDFHLLERCRFRAGYMCMWALGFSAAASNIDFNLTTQGTKGTDRGNMFWHGPMAEFQFLF